MLARFLGCSRPSQLLASQLFNEQTFFDRLKYDLGSARNEIIIESPFMTGRRIDSLRPTLQNAVRRGVTIIVNTRDPREHDDYLRFEAEQAIPTLQEMGVKVLFTGGHHRKLAIIDRTILFEGSLNILSQNDSCEVMRRIYSETIAQQMIKFTGINKFL